MNILLCPGNWFTCSMPGGGEHYLSRLIQQLPQHHFKGIANCKAQFTHNGIEFYQQLGMEDIWVNNNDLFEWADVVWTQLMGNAYAYNKCQQHNKPSVFFAHNTAKSYFTNPKTKIVYNSQTLGDMNLFPERNSFVQTPLIPTAKPYTFEQRKYIALVNCNLNKGAHLFNQLAAELPYSFVGIKGAYGEQILSDRVTYINHGDAIDWSQIKLLLVPSDTESWSQAASEAISHGIPVIATPLPGVKENLSYAGIYIEKSDINLYKETIRWLMESPSIYEKQSELCLKRATEYNNDVSNFNKWLCKE